MTDKRAKDYKYRTRCFKTVKDIENTMYALDEAKTINGKASKQKEIQKLEDNLKQLKELFDQSELKYHKACGSVELARQEWQLAMLRGCDQLQLIEEERINKLDSLIKLYTNQVGDSVKKINKMLDTLKKIEINTKQDVDLISKKYGNSIKLEQELNLIDVYSENTKNMMNRERRIDNLKKWSNLLQNDINAQLRAKEGLDKVRIFNKQNPKFNSNNDDDIALKQNSVNLLKLLFDASLYKINSTLHELDSSLITTKPFFQYSQKIITTYDKLGIPFSILKLVDDDANNLNDRQKPSAPILLNPLSSSSTASNCSNQYESIQMPQPCLHNLYESSPALPPPSYRAVVNDYSNSIEYSDDEWNDSERWLGQCVVQYDYTGERPDELSLKIGDIINVLEKRIDGWWRGQLNGVGTIGLFPSTYVKESF